MQFGSNDILEYMPPAQPNFDMAVGNPKINYMNVHKLTRDVAAVQARIKVVGDHGDLGMSTYFIPALVGCGMAQDYAVDQTPNATRQKICILSSARTY